MKYRVTEKHPVFKVNLLIIKTPDEDHFTVLTDEEKPYVVWEEMSQRDIDRALSEGWIEEIEEVEFTKRDLTGFADFCLSTRIKNIDSAYETWIDIKK